MRPFVGWCQSRRARERAEPIVGDLIDKENWSASGTDLKGDAYEELLAKGGSDKGSGAGQYFTPRNLIRAIFDVIALVIDDRIVDPACGTGASCSSLTSRSPRAQASSRRPNARICGTPSSAGTNSSTAPLGSRP